MNTLLQTANTYLAAGLSIIPIRGDGSKRPVIYWEKYQSEQATACDMRSWFAYVRRGIAILGGKVSGNLEMLDFDTYKFFPYWVDEVDSRAPGVVERLVLVETPKGGRHAYYRCAEIAGNTKLAQHREEGKLRPDIETRGEGGYCIAPGSHACVHPTGRYYSLFAGKLSDIPTVSVKEREAMHEAARLFNRHIVEPRTRACEYVRNQTGTLRPGDDFNLHATWAEVLEPHGWSCVGYSGEVGLWKRPGESRSRNHAKTNYGGTDLLHVFTGSTAFEPDRSYDKFAAYAILNHGGDFSAASRELAIQGYGAGNNTRPIITVKISTGLEATL